MKKYRITDLSTNKTIYRNVYQENGKSYIITKSTINKSFLNPNHKRKKVIVKKSATGKGYFMPYNKLK